MNLLLSLLASCILIASSCKKEKEKETQDNINVMAMGAVGDGIADDTKAFQKSIDMAASKGGGTVVVPKGKYLIDSDSTVKIKSHVTLQMDAAAELIAKPTASERSYILMVVNVTDVNIIGGKITGDRNAHLGSTGEWGMGIGVYAATNVVINGTRVYNCWGDGIVVGATSRYNAPDPSTGVTIKNVVCDNNRRQGLTIGKVNNVIVDSCVFSNTNGTKPMSGIDIEPDKDTAQNIKITNSEFFGNLGNGIEIYVNSSSVVRNVVIQNNFLHNNTYGGYIIRASNVQFNNNRIIQNKYSPPIKAVDTVNCLFTPNTYQ